MNGTTTWRLRTTGNNANGGAFDRASSGTDRSQQDAAYVTFNGTTITAMTSGASVTISISGYTVVAGDVGNVVKISGGTNFIAGRYRIVSVGSGTWTLHTTCSTGSASGMTGRMGGAAVDPGEVADIANSNANLIWMRGGVYTVSSTSLNTAAGPILINSRIFAELGTGVPIFRAATGSLTLITLQYSGMLRDIEIDGNLQTSVRGLAFTNVQSFVVENVTIRKCTDCGVYSSGIGGIRLLRLTVTQCTTNWAIAMEGGNSVENSLIDCNIIGNGAGGITGRSLLIAGGRIADNTGAGIGDGYYGNKRVRNVTIANNSSHGMAFGAGFDSAENCIFANNGGYGIAGASLDDAYTSSARNNCFYSNASGNIQSNVAAVATISGSITATSSPFVNAAGGDYSLSAEGRRRCQGAGYGVIPGSSVASYPDIGGYQARPILSAIGGDR